jgi:hypothetical protein
VLRRVHEAAAAVRKAEHLAGLFFKKNIKKCFCCLGRAPPNKPKKSVS